MSNSKKPPLDRAVATIKASTNTDAAKVAVTQQIAQAMTASPQWATATALQALVKGWSAGAASIAAQATVVAGLRAQLKTATASLQTQRRDWQIAKTQVMSAVTGVAGGSADDVKAFGLDVESRARLGALAAPSDLTVSPAAVSGGVVVKWVKGVAQHGFLVQHATDPNTPSTYSAVVACTKQKLAVTGLPAASTISFRVAAIDPASSTGQSPWSAWVAGSVR